VSNYEGNEKVLKAVLAMIKQRGPISSGLIGFHAENECGLVLFNEDIEAAIDALRMQGHCIIEVEGGLKITSDAVEFEKWRDEVLLPKVEHTRDMLAKMSSRLRGYIHVRDIMIMERGTRAVHLHCKEVIA